MPLPKFKYINSIEYFSLCTGLVIRQILLDFLQNLSEIPGRVESVLSSHAHKFCTQLSEI